MNKKLLLLLGASFLTTSIVVAEEFENSNQKILNTKLEFEGSFDFQAGVLNQKKLTADEKFVSPEKKGMAFSTYAGFRTTFTQILENFTYGGQLVLTPTTQINTSSSFNGSYLFLETEHGRIEAGSPGDAGFKLRISGGDVTAGSGDWSDYARLEQERAKYKELAPEFITYSRYFVSSYKTDILQLTDGTEPARKISYYSPDLDNGFQFGISYIPDSRNSGGKEFGKETDTGIKKYKIPGTDNTMVINTNVRDAVSFGLVYKHNINDGIDLALAGTGEIAKASGNAELVENEDDKKERKVLQKYSIKNLRAYNIGGTLSYGNFAYGLSYGSLNKSLTTPAYNRTGRDTKYYNGAIAYGQGPFKTSLEYFKSMQFKNNLDAMTLGTEFKAAPGLSPYAEVTHFRGKGRPSFYPDAPKSKISGNVFIVGTKLRLKL